MQQQCRNTVRSGERVILVLDLCDSSPMTMTKSTMDPELLLPTWNFSEWRL